MLIRFLIIFSVLLISSCGSSLGQDIDKSNFEIEIDRIQNVDSKMINGKRKKINLDLSLNDQISRQMPSDNKIDNIFESLSADLYSLKIKY
jgi:hypothetical protein|tara:strand:+ start:219 stop:491 length:273 start_codon:yes stop_codon:yes gene_type:complete